MFMYGDIIEEIVIALCKDAGHSVVYEQKELYVKGVKGHCDCVIDGMLIDVKSCSTKTYNKIKQRKLYMDDSFGYLSQLSSYLYALKDDPWVKYKERAGFLIVNKTTGEIDLTVYDLKKELANKIKEVEHKKKVIKQLQAPPVLPTEPFGAQGNEVLCDRCSMCDFKFKCYPGVREFLYSKGPFKESKYFTKIVVEPKVPEVKSAETKS